MSDPGIEVSRVFWVDVIDGTIGMDETWADEQKEKSEA